MKQRIKLAQAMVHGPKLLLLDEPTNGLDPAGREDMLELVRSITHGKGINAIVSSHLLPDVERICDYAMVLVRGRLRSSGPIRDLKKIEGHPVDVEMKEPSGAFVNAAMSSGIQLLSTSAYGYRFQGEGTPDQVLHQLFAAAHSTGAQIRGFQVAERSLEDAFLEAVHE
jgi:ABC-2 type transport system ATP-binding protein